MGCTRDKHIKPNRRTQLIKNPTTLTATSTSSSGVDQNMINNRTNSMFSNPNNPNQIGTPQSQNPSFDDCGWGYCTEEQLQEMLFKNLEYLYNEAISKLVYLGYDEDVALKAVLRNGHCYGGMDVLTNILHNSLAYLNSGSCINDGGSIESELGFADLRQLQDYSLEGMICLLQQVRPHLSRGDAMWCLLMCDLHVGRASTMKIPVIPSSPSSEVMSGMSSSNVGMNVGSSGISVSPGMCKLHGGWGFGNGGKLELSSKGFSPVQREIDCPKRFNLSPSMKSLLKRNVTAFAAGFRAKQQMQMQSQVQPCPISKGTVEEPNGGNNNNNQDLVNSVLNKFKEMNLDENLDRVAEDQKDEIILTLLHQVKDLEKQVKERKEWAHQKALQAAKKLSNDLTELKLLRMEREETQRLKKGKQTLEDTTMKRLSEMENALRKASSQVDRANAAVRQLEVENAEIRAEMEAFKLSASESMTTCLEVAKREKKCLKRLLAWEKQKEKLQEEIAGERRKVSELQQELVRIHAAQKEAEAQWRHEVKQKEIALTQVDEERRSKEATEGNNKRKLEALRLRIEIDFQRHKDDLQRLEQELSRLKATAAGSTTDPPNTVSSGVGGPHFAKGEGETIARLLRELDNEPEKETPGSCERECLVCMKEEVSVVFLPCAHQVMCANCGEEYGKKPGKKAICPCCRVPIEQKVRVFGASS